MTFHRGFLVTGVFKRYSLHGLKHFLTEINRWPDINVDLFAIVTEVCSCMMLSQNVKDHEKIVLMNIIIILSCNAQIDSGSDEES